MLMNRRKLVRMFGGVAAIPVLAGCTVLDALESDRTEVEITNRSVFDPGGVTIKAGEAIVWRNRDSRPHRLSTDPSEFDMDRPVQSPEGATPFTSGELLTNDRYSHTFDVPGEYIYGCTIHPEMIGTIIVE